MSRLDEYENEIIFNISQLKKPKQRRAVLAAFITSLVMNYAEANDESYTEMAGILESAKGIIFMKTLNKGKE